MACLDKCGGGIPDREVLLVFGCDEEDPLRGHWYVVIYLMGDNGWGMREPDSTPGTLFMKVY
jgi:hypothetical protein